VPVKLEHLSSPSQDDWQDLQKIWQDVPTPELQPQSLEAALQSGQWLVAARFNDRIVGVILCSLKRDTVTLQYAAVRSITQRRGVMHQTITLLQQWAANNGYALLAANLPEPLQGAAAARQFEHTNDGWLWQSNNLCK